jgi:hypothetical protein
MKYANSEIQKNCYQCVYFLKSEFWYSAWINCDRTARTKVKSIFTLTSYGLIFRQILCKEFYSTSAVLRGIHTMLTALQLKVFQRNYLPNWRFHFCVTGTNQNAKLWKIFYTLKCNTKKKTNDRERLWKAANRELFISKRKTAQII